MCPLLINVAFATSFIYIPAARVCGCISEQSAVLNCPKATQLSVMTMVSTANLSSALLFQDKISLAITFQNLPEKEEEKKNQLF